MSWFRKGVRVDDEFTAKSAKLEVLKSIGGVSEALVTISEGKYHQVKRMVKACGKTVTYLKRLSIGGLRLDEGLAPGAYRPLTDGELADLKR